jgi:hypothetical protein
LSVAASFPAITTPEAFSSIFAPRKSSKPQPTEVIYTLSSTLNGLESAVHQQQQQQQTSNSEEDLRAAVTQASTSNAECGQTHLDGVPHQDIKLSIQDLAKRFRPFNPPPVPVPMSSEEADVSKERNPETSGAQPIRHRFSTVLTIRESTNPNGIKTYSAHTSPLVRIQDEPSQKGRKIQAPPTSLLRYMERVRRRQEKIHAISVKRQRKLKMKKHKYKKLMKRTRNLRRRLDRN